MIDALHALNHWLSANHGAAEVFVVLIGLWPLWLIIILILVAQRTRSAWFKD